MEFLTGSLLELITQTSTNLPPDVRAAMSLTAGAETPDTQSSQALEHHSVEYRHGRRRRGPDLPGHRHADVRRPHARGREPDRDQEGDSRRPSPKPRGSANCARIRWIRLPEKTAATIWATETPVIHFEQWEEDDIEVKLILKGGGCENKNIQYSVPCELDHLGRADRNLEGVRKCILHAVWQAQGQGCAPGALGVCIGSDRAHGYDLAKEQLFRTLDDVNPNPALAKLEARNHGGSQQARRRRHGLRRESVADRLQDHRGESPAGQFLRFRGVRLLGVPPPGRAARCRDRRDHRSGCIAIPSRPVERMARSEGFPLTGREVVSDRAADGSAGARAESRRRGADQRRDVHRPRQRARVPDEESAAGGSARRGAVSLRPGDAEGGRASGW